MDTLDLSNLSDALQNEMTYLLSSYQTSEATISISPLHGKVKVKRHLRLSSTAMVTVSFEFDDKMYPSSPVKVFVELNDSCKVRDLILPRMQDLKIDLRSISLSSSKDGEGEECLFDLLTIVDSWHSEILLLNQAVLETKVVELEEKNDVSVASYSLRLIYSHHIISPKKIALIHSTAKSLCLIGFVKIGWPGIMVLEGSVESVDEFVSVLESLQWKFINTSHYSKEVFDEEEGEESFLQRHRSFPLNNGKFGLTQIEDKTGMKQLAVVMERAGLSSVFKTILGDYSEVV